MGNSLGACSFAMVEMLVDCVQVFWQSEECDGTLQVDGRRRLSAEHVWTRLE